MTSHYGSENCDVKTQHLAKFETRQQHYYIAKCVGMTMDCDWGIRKGRGGLLGAENLSCSVVKLAVTLLLCAEQLRCSVVKLAVTLLLSAEQLRSSVVTLAVTLLQL